MSPTRRSLALSLAAALVVLGLPVPAAASGDTALGGETSFLGFFTILLLFCCPFAIFVLLGWVPCRGNQRQGLGGV